MTDNKNGNFCYFVVKTHEIAKIQWLLWTLLKSSKSFGEKVEGIFFSVKYTRIACDFSLPFPWKFEINHWFDRIDYKLFIFTIMIIVSQNTPFTNSWTAKSSCKHRTLFSTSNNIFIETPRFKNTTNQNKQTNNESHEKSETCAVRFWKCEIHEVS